MASHFKWYPSDEEVTVPFFARYSFPSQANKTTKLTPRIPPKAGGIFRPGDVIRIEFPAQGYVNPGNTTLEFDLTLITYGTPGTSCISLQNGVASVMQRVRFLYGASPLEDLIGYNMINRCLTEWTGTNQTGTLDQTSINEGVGGCILGNDSLALSATVPMKWGLVNVRQKYIQGIDLSVAGATANFNSGNGFGYVPNKDAGASQTASTTCCTRRYQIPFLLGLMTQDKLLPTKFMASQLAIEISLENAANCIIAAPAGSGTDPTYIISNVNLIPEILEFDASYDALFLKGLQEGGVPIKVLKN